LEQPETAVCDLSRGGCQENRLTATDEIMERDSKRIAREWNREIEADIRRLAASRDDGKWSIVVWTVLEVMWLFGVIGILGVFARLYR